MGRRYLELAREQAVSPETLHRVAALSSGGLDTLRHNGAVITLLAITGMTHRVAYVDDLAITVIKTLTAAPAGRPAPLARTPGRSGGPGGRRPA